MSDAMFGIWEGFSIYEGDKMSIKAGELQDAKRRALNLFDKWNDVTGYFKSGTSYYYEIQSVIEDAVECGAQAASGVKELLEAEK